jgi:predicted ABC-type transport system involved in lysophospholipase L1 biosynthesis ATPase subunit
MVTHEASVAAHCGRKITLVDGRVHGDVSENSGDV